MKSKKGTIKNTSKSSKKIKVRGISSVGRAPALQAGCQEFESPILHNQGYSKMKINLWYCVDMGQWRWTLMDDRDNPYRMESGQQPFLRDAMNDVANTVEYMLETKQQ